MAHHRFGALLATIGTSAILLLSLTAEASTVHPGDELQIKVYNHSDLSATVHVGAGGEISLPLIGEVDSRGLDLQQLSSRISNALRPYIIAPAVEVQVLAQGGSIFVAGNPGGILKYQPGETLSAAMADLQSTAVASVASTAEAASQMAQIQSRGDFHRVTIRRDGSDFGTFDTVALAAKGDSGPELEPGDTIAIANKPIVVHVRGAVVHPGIAYLGPDEPLSAAIAQSGGADATAATAHLTVDRDGVAHDVALGDPIFAQGAMNGDIVTVPAAPRVTVAGVVVTPGPVVLKSDFSLLSAIYTAGGPTKSANIKDVQIVHDGVRTSYDLTALTHGVKTENPQLADGDMVFVPEGHKIDFIGLIQALASVRFLVAP